MKTKIPCFDFQWLLASEPHQTAPVVDEHLAIPRLNYNIPSEIGEAWLESLELNRGFNLYRAVHHFEKVPFGQFVSMLDIKSDTPENTFSAQIWLSGIGCHQEYWNGRNAAPVEVWGAPGHDTFRLNREWDARVQIGGGGTTEMRSIIIPESMLLTLLGESHTNQLLERLGLSKAVKAVTRPIPHHVNAPFKDAMSDKYSGSVRRLFAQARVLDYMGELTRFLFSDYKKPVDRRHANRIFELKDHLLSFEGQLPTLNQLAQDFGLSAKQLNAAFKAEFGQSPFAFVSAHRLEQAHEALRESNLPTKQISARLGYSHVNHFTNAFKKKFGYPPGSLRNRGLNKDQDPVIPEIRRPLQARNIPSELPSRRSALGN